MAIVSLTNLFADLSDWPGRLFDAGSPPEINAATANQFVFTHTSGSFDGFSIEVIGTGFTFDADEPTGGKMTGLRVLDADGEPVLMFSKLNANAFASDLAQFFASVFGSDDGFGNGISPQTEIAWSQLLTGNDTIIGTDQDDKQGLAGFDAGNDLYDMRGGDDWVAGNRGNDTIKGGSGYDVLSFEETNYSPGMAAIRGAQINVQTGIVLDPWGGRDVVSGIEDFRGSRFNDSFIGSNKLQDHFMGSRGRDSFDGGANSFTSAGKPGADNRDELRYDRDANDGGKRGIIVDLETSFGSNSVRGTIRDGFGHLDTVRDIERVVGTKFSDTFVGSRMDNVFAGGKGTDSYSGEGGFDTVDFGRPTDNSGPDNGVVIDMRWAFGQVLDDGYGNEETLISIEGFRGTDFADSVIGSSKNERMDLGRGTDTMTGGGGSDTFIWTDQDEFGEGDVVNDFTTSGPGADRLAFETSGFSGMTRTLRLVNGTEATQTGVGTFVFDTSSDTLYWDADGKGGAAAVAIVTLIGVGNLTAANFDLW